MAAVQMIDLAPKIPEYQNNIQTKLHSVDDYLIAAQAQVRGLEGQSRSARFNLQHTIEDVNNQVAVLRANVAAAAAPSPGALVVALAAANLSASDADEPPFAKLDPPAFAITPPPRSTPESHRRPS
jgi:hypothetical protein